MFAEYIDVEEKAAIVRLECPLYHQQSLICIDLETISGSLTEHDVRSWPSNGSRR